MDYADILKRASSFEDVREQLFAIRCKSKRGRAISPDEMRFCERCMLRWPNEYRGMTTEIFNQTAPFGSRLQGKEEKP